MNSYSIFLFKDENNCHKEKSLCLMQLYTVRILKTDILFQQTIKSPY